MVDIPFFSKLVRRWKKKMYNQSDIFLEFFKDNITGEYQVLISDYNIGSRLAGPKFLGASHKIYSFRIIESNANEIRLYLDKTFPKNNSED